MSGIRTGELEAIIVNSIEEVIEDNEEALQGNVKAAGNKAVRMLKERSRKRKRHGGSYAKGWSADVKTEATGTTCVVHNRQYQLTHLLENGHAIKNQCGSYPGKVAGDHVIEGVYKEVAAEFSKGAQ
ncbi:MULTISPECIES: HK97 gp10 family phage protein [Collinsella]|uniref:HK97 gp10 family phage protein n=1 Tax=Collinsella TaxID=102106 RepID=UPI000E46F664|nr:MULTISPECIES: HK97 gp10 family phage protein [Collinsella]RHD35865.1 hypothetical protein DW796_04660 [Collinsella sp. AM31-2AC]